MLRSPQNQSKSQNNTPIYLTLGGEKVLAMNFEQANLVIAACAKRIPEGKRYMEASAAIQTKTGVMQFRFSVNRNDSRNFQLEYLTNAYTRRPLHLS